MYLDSEKKKEIFGNYGKSNTDTGSPESQIALFSVRIAHLTEHLKVNKKDHTTQRALKMLASARTSTVIAPSSPARSLVSASKNGLLCK